MVQWFCQLLTSVAPKGYFYTVVEGRKYLKIVMHTSHGSRSVHAFIDKKTLDLYKAATWAAPAKGIRYNLNTDQETLKNVIDWAGGYLYK